MTAATIEVRAIEPAPPGKKQAKLTSASGHVFQVWPEMLGLLQPGRRYAIEYTTRDYRGRPYHTIRKVKPVDAPQARASSPGATPAQPRNVSRETFAASDDVVGAIVAAMIHAGLVEPTEQAITAAIVIARNAYRRSLS